MTTSAKRKGDKAEAEIARLLSDLTGWQVRRAYGAGRPDDIGDLSGLPYCVAQVRNWPHDVLAAERTALHDAKEQAARVDGVRFPVALVRHVGGGWTTVMAPSTFAELLRLAAAALDHRTQRNDKRMMRSVFPARPGEATTELARPTESDDRCPTCGDSSEQRDVDFDTGHVDVACGDEWHDRASPPLGTV